MCMVLSPPTFFFFLHEKTGECRWILFSFPFLALLFGPISGIENSQFNFTKPCAIKGL